MICLGRNAAVPSRPLEREAAQLVVLFAFRQDFLKREPTGIVLTEYEHLAATTRAPNNPGGLQSSTGTPNLNRVLRALATDYRSWIPGRDRRKSDVLAISGDGRRGELIEVTTYTNAGSAEKQLREKLRALRDGVNVASGLPTDWRGSAWLPSPKLRFTTAAILSTIAGRIRYLCYEPTRRERASTGVILYEVHEVQAPPVRQPVRMPVTVFVPDGIRLPIVAEYRQWQPAVNDADRWAEVVVNRHPETSPLLQSLALLAGAAAAVVAIGLALDPVPGDEVPAVAAAMSLFRYAGVAF